ncbi:MAG: response regulator [Planctomycetes bacterium]|nr:response regulator [Planctomycetota bacterium]
MIAFVEATVLTIGLNGKSDALKNLPINVLKMQSGFEAARSLKNTKIDSVICKWDLDDMKGGEFLRRLKMVKPNIPTIALIRAGDIAQEIQARSIGVSAVLTEETDDSLFTEMVANILSLNVNVE